MYSIVSPLAIAANFLALYFNLRLKRTYFLDSKFFLALANIGYVLFLIESFLSRLANVPSSITLEVVLNGFMALCIGFASFLLEKKGTGTAFREMREFLGSPPRTFIVYSLIVATWTISSVLLQPFRLEQTAQIQGQPSYYYSYDTWWLVFSSLLLSSFYAGPVLSMYRQSLRVRDTTVVRSMRILSVCWIGFGFVQFFQATAGAYTEIAQNMGALLDSIFFVMISLALKEPSLLGRIVGNLEPMTEAVYGSDSDTIILYSMDSDRRKLVETFVRQELANRREVVCFVPKSDTPFYTALVRRAISVDGSSTDSIKVQPIEMVLAEPSEPTILHPGFQRSHRELIDLADLDESIGRRLLDRVKGMDALPGQRRPGRVWAMKVEDTNPDLVSEIRQSSGRARVLDLAGHQDSFSKLVGKEHPAIVGNRFLVEYDPSVNFEELVLSFAREFQANVEPVSVFTSAGSPVYLRVKGEHGVRVFGFSSKTSTPLRISEEEVLLPERDSSLLLDAVDKVLKVPVGRSTGIALDMVTDLVLSLGFDKTYGVLSSILEMVESESATLLVLVNHFALDEKTLNGIRSLFRYQLRFTGNGLERVRIPDAAPRRFDDMTLSLDTSVSTAGD